MRNRIRQREINIFLFCRAVELDDIFVQAISRKSRVSILNLMKKAEQRIRSQSSEDVGIAGLDSMPDTSSKRNMRRHSKDITASVFEEELLRTSMNQMRVSEQVKPAFPIANAVRKYPSYVAVRVMIDVTFHR